MLAKSTKSFFIGAALAGVVAVVALGAVMISSTGNASGGNVAAASSISRDITPKKAELAIDKGTEDSCSSSKSSCCPSH